MAKLSPKTADLPVLFWAPINETEAFASYIRDQLLESLRSKNLSTRFNSDLKEAKTEGKRVVARC
jgi:hypothetical protein